MIGTWTGGTSGGTPLIVTFNASATPAAAQALARNITFANVSETPVAAPRTLRMAVTDGDGGTSAIASTTMSASLSTSPTPSTTKSWNRAVCPAYPHWPKNPAWPERSRSRLRFS